MGSKSAQGDRNGSSDRRNFKPHSTPKLAV